MNVNSEKIAVGTIRQSLLSIVLSLLLSGVNTAFAADWSTTEIHYQNGNLDNAYAAGSTDTTLFTLQHASGWKYGSHFFFVDQISTTGNDDFYGELYSTFSLGKMMGKTVGAGALLDVGVVFGINVAGDANVKKYLPGVSLSWKVTGFNYLDTLITAYIDDTVGDQAPKEDNSFMIDCAWDYPFSIGAQEFTISGHMEYIHERDNAFGSTVESWVLLQPQLRYDIGKQLFDVDKQLYVGIEYQLWTNKLGDGNTDEKTGLLLVVWRL